MTDAYEPITQEEFDKRLLAMLEEMTAAQLLDIPGITEIVSEHFNNDILCDYEAENEHYRTEEQCFNSFLRGRTMREIKHEYNDDIMLREDYNNYTDMLCKDGEISSYLYNNMDNPF